MIDGDIDGVLCRLKVMNCDHAWTRGTMCTDDDDDDDDATNNATATVAAAYNLRFIVRE